MNKEVKQVSLDEMFPIMEEQLKNGGTVTFNPRGTSMLPLIRQGIDRVTLTKKPSVLKKYHIAFYRRTDGSFILHRIVDLASDGSFIMCGDNQTELEKGITEEQIIGIVSGMYRGEKYYSASSVFMWRFRTYAVIRRWFRKSFLKRAIKWGLKKCRIKK